jgi:hypothetical protein
MLNMSSLVAAAAGLIAGVFVAGALAALLVGLVPSPIRGPAMLWGVTGAAIAVCVWVALWLVDPRRSRRE